MSTTTTFSATSTGRSGSTQDWVVPNSGPYRIVVRGAQGGYAYLLSSTTINPGGDGAIMEGDFDLTEGHTIRMMVGHIGGNVAADNRGGSGGGATYVYNVTTNTLLMIAGGGGGGGQYEFTGKHANVTANGSAGSSSSSNTGGGAGGTAPNGGNNSTYGAGGGGYSGNGGSGSGTTGGASYTNGGTGGTGHSSGADGGYGGGGGSYAGGGGGGGYGGGGGGAWSYSGDGGGGGSLNNGTNQSNRVGGTGNGSVEITSQSILVEPVVGTLNFAVSTPEVFVFAAIDVPTLVLSAHDPHASMTYPDNNLYGELEDSLKTYEGLETRTYEELESLDFAQVVEPLAVTLAATANDATIATSITPTLGTATFVANDAMVTVGSVTRTATEVALTANANDATVSITVVSVVADLGAVTYDAQAVAGALARTPTLASADWVGYDATTSSSVAVSSVLADISSTAHDAAVVVGAVVLTPTLVNLTFTASDVTALTTVSPSVIETALTIHAVEIATGGVEVVPELATLSLVTDTPQVIQRVHSATITLQFEVESAISALAVSPASVTATIVANDAEVVVGAVSQTPVLASLVGQIEPVTLSLGVVSTDATVGSVSFVAHEAESASSRTVVPDVPILSLTANGGSIVAMRAVTPAEVGSVFTAMDAPLVIGGVEVTVVSSELSVAAVTPTVLTLVVADTLAMQFLGHDGGTVIGAASVVPSPASSVLTALSQPLVLGEVIVTGEGVGLRFRAHHEGFPDPTPGAHENEVHPGQLEPDRPRHFTPVAQSAPVARDDRQRHWTR